MGTRSLTHVIEVYTDDRGIKVKKPITTMYRQYDGYIKGHGKELVEFLTSAKLVNGFSGSEPQFNGVCCLAAQMYARFKTGTGDIYCYPPDTKDAWEEYVYTVYVDDNKGTITLKVEDTYEDGHVLYEGEAAGLLELEEKVE